MKDMSLREIYNLTCNATAWRELFWFPPSTNVTALTSLVCVLNEKEADQFMATLMMVSYLMAFEIFFFKPTTYIAKQN